MITKTTAELRPGDVVETEHGFLHRIIKTIEPARGGFDIRFVHPISIPAPYGAWAEAEDEWQVVEPSKLDLAVQRAQELADKYDQPDSFVTESDEHADLRVLLELFRAAR